MEELAQIIRRCPLRFELTNAERTVGRQRGKPRIGIAAPPKVSFRNPGDWVACVET